MVGPAARALPEVAAVAVAVAGWCVKGALTSVPPCAIQDAASRATDEAVPPPNYMMNAIFACPGGCSWRSYHPGNACKIRRSSFSFRYQNEELRLIDIPCCTTVLHGGTFPISVIFNLLWKNIPTIFK